jgi:NDP-sugar pyrophosphorylase family protein
MDAVRAGSLNERWLWVLGAIVIAGPEIGEVECGAVASKPSAAASHVRLQSGTPLACVDVLGRSTVDRIIEELQHAGIEAITLLADISLAGARRDIDRSTNSLPFLWVEDAWCGVTHVLNNYKERGVETTFVLRVGPYAELDLADALQFHREQHEIATRAFDGRGSLDVWILDTARIADGEEIAPKLKTIMSARYSVSGYVNRLENPADLRRLAVDGLTSRCRLRPSGSEARPGLWIGEGAQVHKGARIVAPAFIGKGSRIEEQCLITRSTNVESHCMVDYGTVVEDSAILSNSYVGIGLDISHSIVNGNSLLNLEREVALEIMDPGVIRQNRVLRKGASHPSPAEFAPAGMILASVEESMQ